MIWADVETGEPYDFVVPEDRYHDEWDGAAGCEHTDEVYSPYVHAWDSTLMYCQVIFAIERRPFEDGMVFTRTIDQLPGWTVRRALPCLPRKYWQDRYYDDGRRL